MLFNDLRYALRMLRKSPGFTLVAAVTLALGIGATTGMFSVLNAVVLRPLPYKDPGRLVEIWSTDPKGVSTEVSPPDYEDIVKQTRLLSGAALFEVAGANLTGVEQAEALGGARVSASLFHVLGVEPVLGRTFSEEEEQSGGARVVVLSHDLWVREFASSAGIIGRTLHLNGQAFTVAGVMPAGFSFPYHSEFWEPLNLNANVRTSRLARAYVPLARLRDGVTLKSAQAELNTIAARLGDQFPLTNYKWGFRLEPLKEVVIGGAGSPLWTLFGAVLFVLLAACANLASLLLARYATRRREIAVRAALGASRARIVRHLLAEALALAALGGGVGLLVAWGMVDAVRAFGPADLPRMTEISVDPWVLGFTLVTSLLTAFLFGLVPALHTSSQDINQYLKEGAMTSRAGFGLTGKHRLRSALVVAQVAQASVLLVGAGLLIRSFSNLIGTRLGFNPSRVLSLQIFRPFSNLSAMSSQAAFFDEVLTRVRALPGVQEAALTDGVLLEGRHMNVVFDIPGHPGPAPGEQFVAEFQSVSPDFFRVLRIPLLKGRFFTNSDGAGAPAVVIVNQSFARRYFPNQDPTGQTLADVPRVERPAQIVGVVGDTRDVELGSPPRPIIFASFLQAPDLFMALLVRSQSAPLALVPSIRARIREVDRDQPLTHIGTLDQFLSRSVAEPRDRTLLLSAFAGLAAMVALVGLYGVVSQAVTDRTHEIGIRMALGAQRVDVLQLMLRQAVTLVLIGVAVGAAGAFALTRFLTAMLYGVRPLDPWSFVMAVIGMVAVCALAAFIPARRAMKVDPVSALRYE